MSSNELETVLVHRKLANQHYSNYQLYYERNNYPKASEFLWGTLNTLFYAIGLFYRKKLSTYSKIKDFLPDFIEETDDTTIIDEYRAAETLHANFYHDFMEEDNFNHNNDKVVSLIEKLVGILDKKIDSFTE